MEVELFDITERERRLRLMLGLAPDRPDPIGTEALSSDQDLSDEELAAQFAAWHKEDFRADLAAFLARLPARIRDFAQEVWTKAKEPFYRWRTERALAR